MNRTSPPSPSSPDGRILKSLHVVLYQPEIPQNTGNIARTCAAVGASLHLIEPLGFSLEDRYLRRAGLDYWSMVEVTTHPGLEAFLAAHGNGNLALISKTGGQSYDRIAPEGHLYLIFGRETAGLPSEFLESRRDYCFRLPMRPEARSLNISNAVAVVVYETLRKSGFQDLKI